MLRSNDLFDYFRTLFEKADIVNQLRDGLIGKGVKIPGPFGPRSLLYADYTATGRPIAQIEHTILTKVLPYYANTHTDASFCGEYTSSLRESARSLIATFCGATEAHAVIFAGSGVTAGLNRLVHLLGVREASATNRRATVIVGPYEHHSNILPWREAGARVVELPEAEGGGPDLDALDEVLAGSDGLVIGAFSAASNVTGITTDVALITEKLKQNGALAVWDYATGGPYLPIRMTPKQNAPIDAVVLSPHKFIGGPGASGLLIIRKGAISAQTPTFPGGGTVRFVSSETHDYTLDVSEREEGGTPNIVGDIRSALSLMVKDMIGEEWISSINAHLSKFVLKEMSQIPRVRLLGGQQAPRLPIFSFIVESRSLDAVPPQFTTRLLSDYFGIQVRGGCACAGPYGHRLLNIDQERSNTLRKSILAGNSNEKPGFVRFNTSYLFTPGEIERLLDAIRRLPDLTDRYRHFYRHNEEKGTFVYSGAGVTA